MEIDLARAGSDLEGLARRLESQVCVIGGGIAGLVLTSRLVQAGISVTLLEAGGREPSPSSEADPFGAESRGHLHASTRAGRVRALGGCSLTWGGQLLPQSEDADWPVSASELAPFAAEAEQLLGVDSLPYEAAPFFRAARANAPAIAGEDTGLVPRVSKFVAFGRRSLASTIGRDLLESANAKVVLNGPVVRLVLAPTGDAVSSVVVQPPTGLPIEIRAKQIALAAGTVEVCRLLLASGIGGTDGQVGVNLHDHLTLPVAIFRGRARREVLRRLRPWVYFEPRAATVHSVKLEPGLKMRSELGMNAGMAHVTVEEPPDSGPALVREVLRARQQGRGWAEVRANGPQVPAALLEAVRFGWWARVRHRRYVSSRATVRLQINVAQDRPSASRVLLSDDTDRIGIPRAIVDWRISERELESVRRFAAFLRKMLDHQRIGEGIEWEPGVNDARLVGLIDDARHAMGGACMGVDPRTSVVDPELRVHGMANLSVASAAVFPDGSPQLPTLTLAALCLRLAERLARELA